MPQLKDGPFTPKFMYHGSFEANLSTARVIIHEHFKLVDQKYDQDPNICISWVKGKNNIYKQYNQSVIVIGYVLRENNEYQYLKIPYLKITFGNEYVMFESQNFGADVEEKKLFAEILRKILSFMETNTVETLITCVNENAHNVFTAINNEFLTFFDEAIKKMESNIKWNESATANLELRQRLRDAKKARNEQDERCGIPPVYN